VPDQAKSFESDRMSIHGGPENRACVRFSTLFFRSMAFLRRRIPAVPIKMLAGRMTVRFGRPSTASAQEWAGVAKKAVDATRLLRRSSSLLFLFVRGVQRLQKYQFFRVAIKPRGTILGTKKTGPKIERKPGFKGMSERHRLGIIQLAVVRLNRPIGQDRTIDEWFFSSVECCFSSVGLFCFPEAEKSKAPTVHSGWGPKHPELVLAAPHPRISLP